MITVFSKPNCGQCILTTRILDARKVAYKTVDLTKTPEALEQVKALGYLSAPVVVTDTEHWVGFRPDKLNTLT